MAVAHDADSNANSGTTSGDLTWSHTCTGSNLLLVVGLGWTGAGITMTTLKYNGVSFTGSTALITTPALSYNSQVFWWVAPSTGANNIVAHLSGTQFLYGGGTSFTGVDQTTPVPNNITNTGASFGTVSQSLTTTNDNEMLVNVLAMANATSTITADATATQSYNQSNATEARTTGGEYKVATTHGANATTWSISGSTNRNWANTVIGINPVQTSAAPIGKDIMNLNNTLGANISQALNCSGNF